MNKIWSPPALAVALLLALPAGIALAQDDATVATVARNAAAELPVTRVVLFTSGIGYFEHTGKVQGTVEVELAVAGEQMDDLLQSLVLQDFDGGMVEPVRYPARDPLGRVLGSYSLDLSGDPTLADLLSQARGEPMLVTASETLRGILVNVERVQPPEEEPKAYLTLATAEGLQRVTLAEVRRLRFERPELQQELEAALAALSRYRENDESGVRLRFSGDGTRRVSVAYVREMPVWKTSYRLVLQEDGEATLQGWAIFDNPTSTDLEDIIVSFVAGQPLSFISSLYEPVYVERPRVEARAGPQVVPPAYDRDFEAAPAPMEEEAAAARRAIEQSRTAAMAAPGSAGVAAMADGTRTGTAFEYRVSRPVTIPRYESAMIPIVQQSVQVQELSIYDSSLLAEHPLRGLRLSNDTGLHLAAGPVSVFVASGFAGNARIGDIVAGDSRMLTFAVDLDVEVEKVSSSEPEQVVSVALRNGMVETSSLSRTSTQYRASMRGEEERFLVIEHPKRGGFEVVSPQPPPVETAGSYRFGMALAGAEGEAGEGRGEVELNDVPTHASCESGTSCTLTVVMERIDRRTLAVSNMSSEQVAFYLENVELSESDRESLAQILVLKQRMAELDELLYSRGFDIDAIHRDQERIRQNMGELERDSSLYRRYLSDLEEQENQLDSIEVEMEELRRLRRENQEELNRMLSEL